ncbi:uncharacterized protein LOC117208663, partial [Bombus bifarius]|uniref:Uncharacterized protein LOC117208663 n=1 Tax=Bombus bifarius TaxID=103933 RepID=A0A6P8MCF8_9HYME
LVSHRQSLRRFFIGLGIVFCGCAMVHNVFVWQREKTNAVKALAREQCEAAVQLQRQQQLQQHQNQPQLAAQRKSAPIAATHNHQNVSGHRNVVTPPDTSADRSPPDTSADRSPPSPGNKLNRSQHLPREATGSVSPGLPAATLDLSSAATTNSPHELSTLV